VHVSGMSWIGWLHTIACIVALGLGGWNLVALKGSPGHKFRGTAYAATMVVAMALSFGIYHFDISLRSGRIGPRVFGFFHWLSVAALALTVLGYYASTRQQRAFWAYTHPIAMTLTYYLLVGGLINELFARLDVLRPFAFAIVNGQRVFTTTPAIQDTRVATELATLIVLLLFVVKVWRYRRHQRSATENLANVTSNAG
jgi:uncharacterized membrane protein